MAARMSQDTSVRGAGPLYSFLVKEMVFDLHIVFWDWELTCSPQISNSELIKTQDNRWSGRRESLFFS